MRRYIIATPLPPRHELLAGLRGTGLVEGVVHSQADLDQVGGRTIVMLSWLHILNEPFLRKQQEVLNVHNSLLPRYRGRHAFTWAMIHGESEVGYSMHTAETRVDSGPIYSQVRIPILPEDDINTLFRRAHDVLQDWLPEQLSLHSRGLLVPIPQDEKLATYFRARKPDDGRLKWDQSFESIRNFVRAQRPPYTPGAFVEHKGQRLYANHCVAREPLRAGADPGQVLSVEPTESRLTIACRDVKVDIYFVQGATSDMDVFKVGERLL
jgi:methionyl-tRNA formyltransferase